MSAGISLRFAKQNANEISKECSRNVPSLNKVGFQVESGLMWLIYRYIDFIKFISSWDAL